VSDPAFDHAGAAREAAMALRDKAKWPA